MRANRHLLLGVATVGYVLPLMVFASSTPAVASLMLLPVVAAGAMYGTRMVSATVAGLSALTVAVFWFVGPGSDQVDWYFGIALLLVLFVGLVTGRLHDTSEALNTELHNRTILENELWNTREKLETLVGSKDELIAAVGHELRTPLTAVLGFAELLRLGTHSDMDPSDRDELVAYIAREAFELSGVVDDLLVASRLEIGSLSLTSVPVALRPLAEDIVEDLRPGTGHKTIEVTGGGVKAIADPGRVHQIVRNLITNALAYGGDTIRIVIREAGHHAVLEARDDGGGLPDDQWEAIFQPHYSYHDTDSQPRNIGLGLSVSRSLAELMAGTLDYRYESGESILTLRLPRHSLIPG